MSLLSAKLLTYLDLSIYPNRTDTQFKFCNLHKVYHSDMSPNVLSHWVLQIYTNAGLHPQFHYSIMCNIDTHNLTRYTATIQNPTRHTAQAAHSMLCTAQCPGPQSDTLTKTHRLKQMCNSQFKCSVDNKTSYTVWHSNSQTQQPWVHGYITLSSTTLLNISIFKWMLKTTSEIVQWSC